MEVILGYWKILVMLLQDLFMLFFNGLQSLQVPKEWRLANAVTIFKKGKKEDSGNYRPVCLPSVVKLCSYWHLLINTWKMTQSLFIARFIRRKSCLTNLISFCDKVTHLADQRKTVEVLFDFSKAFDAVFHRIFLDKMCIQLKEEKGWPHQSQKLPQGGL